MDINYDMLKAAYDSIKRSDTKKYILIAPDGQANIATARELLTVLLPESGLISSYEPPKD